MDHDWQGITVRQPVLNKHAYCAGRSWWIFGKDVLGRLAKPHKPETVLSL